MSTTLKEVLAAEPRVEAAVRTHRLPDKAEMHVVVTGMNERYAVVSFADPLPDGGTAISDPTNVFVLDKDAYQGLLESDVPLSESRQFLKSKSEWSEWSSSPSSRDVREEPTGPTPEQQAEVQTKAEAEIYKNSEKYIAEAVRMMDPKGDFDISQIMGVQTVIMPDGTKAPCQACIFAASPTGGRFPVQITTWNPYGKQMVIGMYRNTERTFKEFMIEEVQKVTKVGIGFTYGVMSSIDPSKFDKDAVQAKPGDPVYSKGEPKTNPQTGGGITFNASFMKQHFEYRFRATYSFMWESASVHVIKTGFE